MTLSPLPDLVNQRLNALLAHLTATPQTVVQLAAQLDSPVSALEQALEHLADTALPVVHLAQGYALLPDTPAPAIVKRHRLGQHFWYVAYTDSTQQEVLRLTQQLEPGAEPHGAVVVAEQQSQGRGRRGRAWHSGTKSLLFSVLLRQNPQGQALSGADLAVLPFVCGVALQAACPAGWLKWPNDLLSSDGRKLAGILVEAEWRAGAVRQVVLGVGVNVTGAPTGAAALSEFVPDINRAQVLEDFLVQLDYWLRQPTAQVLAAWRTKNLTLGREVSIQRGHDALRGTARDIGPAGELLLDTEQGLQVITGGDVHLIGTLLNIRRALPTDALQAAPLILAANGELAWHLTGTASDEQALGALQELFAQTGQRFSYEHAWVMERGQELLGLALAYPGDKALALDQHLQQYLASKGYRHQVITEGQRGELYIDTLAVSPAMRGQGLGAKLLQHLQQVQAKSAPTQPLGLLVEHNNPAKRLYERLGFQKTGEQVLQGHLYERLNWFSSPLFEDKS